MRNFWGYFPPRFSRPVTGFVGDMLCGLQAAQDVKPSCIGRGLGEGTALKKTEERLSRHLAREGLGEGICRVIAAHGARHVGRDTLLVVDPTDIRKLYAKRMPYLATVRDGSEGTPGEGYWACAAVACESGGRRAVPLHLRLWSCEAPGFTSENGEITSVIDTVRAGAGRRGIYATGRGGGRGVLFSHLLDNGLRFITRLVGDRRLVWRRKAPAAEGIAAQCPMRYAETLRRETEDGARRYEMQYGATDVLLPGRGEPLRLVVVKGLGAKPLLLLTNANGGGSRKDLWQAVEGYLARWRVEDAIRFIKQSYRLEDIRLLDYTRLRNMMALVLAAAYFVSSWLGESTRRGILVRNITRVSKRLSGVPDFHYYALSDGIARLLNRCGRWCRRHAVGATCAHGDRQQELPLFAPG